jgi:uncharacterized protein (DUF362 family)
MIPESLQDSRVASALLPHPEYTPHAVREVYSAIESAARELGLADAARGPLGRVIPAGSRVVIKPNLVTHKNQGPWSVQPLVTHTGVIRAATEAALQAGAASVLVGDAPIQSCDFEKLLAETNLDEWANALAVVERRFLGIRDFRRTTCEFDTRGVRLAIENRLPEDRFVLFDLGCDSLLEPVTDGRGSFRVTCYDPRLMARTHARGRHRYLVAREILDADVVVNVPKLKTHMKAGITCALKNLVGINGNKEFLPHHRMGGAGRGGDCYPGVSRLKLALEHVTDRENSAQSRTAAWMWHQASRALVRATRMAGDQLGIEGAWSGNDTVWRMTLDLNRIVLYGRPDGTLASRPVRRVVHVIDGVIAGQGNGPLAPKPLPLGLILLGQNAAAVDWVGAQILGYEPDRVPLVREAFQPFRWPIASFGASDVQLIGAPAAAAPAIESAIQVEHPTGWRDAARRARLAATA